MHIKKILSVASLAGLLVLPIMGLAAELVPEGEKAPQVVTTGQDLIDLIGTIGNWIFFILMTVASVLLIVAGFFWVTAGGDPANVTKARTMLINALIGVAIALGAKGLVAVIRSIIAP